MYPTYLACLLDAERLHGEYGFPHVEHGRVMQFYKNLISGKQEEPTAQRPQAIEPDYDVPASDARARAPRARARALAEVRHDGPPLAVDESEHSDASFDLELELERFMEEAGVDSASQPSRVVVGGTATPIAPPSHPPPDHLAALAVLVAEPARPARPDPGVVRQTHRWGPFCMTPKPPSRTEPWGRWEAACPFHFKNAKQGAKRQTK